MKDKNQKDPYNLEEIDEYIKNRKETIGEKKQVYGKIYRKSKLSENNRQSKTNSL